MHPRAIETRYKGYRFRSRLEARWAVFFDHLGLRWEYEPEGFDLGDGVRYLPDFLLQPSMQHFVPRATYVEVKHPGSRESDWQKAKMLAAKMNKRVLLLTSIDRAECANTLMLGNGDYWKLFRFGFTENADINDSAVLDRRLTPTPYNVLLALYAARGARFEHGERGAGR